MNKYFPKIYLEPTHKFTFKEKIDDVFYLGKNGWFVILKEKTSLIKLDKNLNFKWEKDLNIKFKEYVRPRVSYSRKLELIAITSLNEIRIIDKNEVEVFSLKHKKWHAFNGVPVFFTPDGKFIINILPFENRGDDLLQIRNVNKDFSIHKEFKIPCYYSAYNFIYLKNSNQILLEAAFGQDGTHLFNISYKLSQFYFLELKEHSDRIIGNTNLTQNEIITADHGRESITIYCEKDLKPIRKITIENLFDKNLEKIQLGFYALFIDSENILFDANEKFYSYNLKHKRIDGEISCRDENSFYPVMKTHGKFKAISENVLKLYKTNNQ